MFGGEFGSEILSRVLQPLVKQTEEAAILSLQQATQQAVKQGLEGVFGASAIGPGQVAAAPAVAASNVISISAARPARAAPSYNSDDSGIFG